MTGEMGAGGVILRVDRVSKRFPGVLANDAVSVDIAQGEIHCLLGENGAGKTTLADILYGVHRPDEGTLYLKGGPLAMSSPKDAIGAGIGMVHQHFEFVPPMSVIENVIIGTHAQQWLDMGAARRRLQELFDAYDVRIDPDAEVGRLSVGEQQWIEIFKALYFGLEVLILDEPTAVLTPQGVEQLFRILRQMQSEGLTVILITHKLNEVMEISDRVTVLRRGKVVGTVDTADVTRSDLARMMVGRDVVFTVENEGGAPGGLLLEVEDVHLESESGRGSLEGLSLTVREGEIVGIAGVSGNGQNVLFDALVGVSHPESGEIRLSGRSTAGLSARKIAAMGVASVPGDRIRQGLVMDFRVKENLILGRHRSRPYAWGGVLRRRPVDDFAKQSIDEFEIMTPSAAHVTRTLSGGNLQKVIMARELSRTPKLLVVHQPTRGLDIGAAEYVRRRLIQERDNGAGVLLMSEDLDEIFNLSDRIAVIYEGRIAAETRPGGASLEEVGLWMAGISAEAAAGAAA